MSLGGGGGTQTTTTQVDVPQWYQQAQQGNINRATQIANRPYVPYQGPRVADWTGDQNQAFDMVRGQVGQSDAAYAEAADYMRQGANPVEAQGYAAAMTSAPNAKYTTYSAPTIADAQGYAIRQQAPTAQVQAPNLGSAQGYAAAMGADAMAPYQNAYNDQVIDRAMVDIDRLEDRELSQARRRAGANSAFGGSRTAIMESEIGRRYDDARMDTIADLRRDGFNTSLQAGQADAGRMSDAARYAADMGNNFALQGANMDLTASSANAAAENAMALDTAARADAAGAFRASAANDRNMAQAGMIDAAQRYGSDAFNQAEALNAGFDADAANRNADATNMARQFAAQMGFDAGALNAANARAVGQGLQGLEGVSRNATMQDTQRLFDIGERERGLRQRGMDLGYEDFERQRQHAIQGLQYMIGATSGVPQGMFGTTTTAPRQDNTMQNVGTAIQGAATIASMFSDRRLKQDIIDLGGGLYEFAYKWDPSERFVGVMADEVPERYRITGMSGFDMVDYGLMAMEAA